MNIGAYRGNSLQEWVDQLFHVHVCVHCRIAEEDTQNEDEKNDTTDSREHIPATMLECADCDAVIHKECLRAISIAKPNAAAPADSADIAKESAWRCRKCIEEERREDEKDANNYHIDDDNVVNNDDENGRIQPSDEDSGGSSDTDVSTDY